MLAYDRLTTRAETLEAIIATAVEGRIEARLLEQQLVATRLAIADIDAEIAIREAAATEETAAAPVAEPEPEPQQKPRRQAKAKTKAKAPPAAANDAEPPRREWSDERRAKFQETVRRKREAAEKQSELLRQSLRGVA
jgi:hypothetical protein